MAGDRNSDDVDDRIEWQLDQVRLALFVLVGIAVLGIVLAVVTGMLTDASSV
jgi:type II secretory pathway component PulF